MTQLNPSPIKLVLDGLSRQPAHTAATLLQDVFAPPSDALTIFEEGTAWRIDAYYSDQSVAENALQQLGDFDAHLITHATFEAIDDINWVAVSQAALPPVFAGRFTICGGHDLDKVGRGPNTLVIEASEAFGTAHHATTYGCILALERISAGNTFRRILDLGTGSGILALAMARRHPDATIIASDCDERSIEVAKENAYNNAQSAISGGPTFLVAEGVRAPSIIHNAPYDLIVANILANPLIALAPKIANVTAKPGVVILSGLLVEQANQVIARYRSLGFALIRHDRHADWSTLTLRAHPHRGRSQQ